ncbi:hypothetical protein SDJN02_19691, partial [Cucurbita argyrosperma subsp. argyrosperma]
MEEDSNSERIFLKAEGGVLLDSAPTPFSSPNIWWTTLGKVIEITATGQKDKMKLRITYHIKVTKTVDISDSVYQAANHQSHVLVKQAEDVRVVLFEHFCKHDQLDKQMD